ncbi:MAG: glycosyltransferase [Planctomycetota bacterium]
MPRPIRVIHFVAGLGRGGVESWLAEVAKRIDRDRFKFDIAVHLPEKPGDYTQDVLATGSLIHRLPPPSQPLAFAPALYRLLRGASGYDIVHTHVHLFNGVVITLARLAGVPVRLAHSRGVNPPPDNASWIARSVYPAAMRRLIDASATRRLAVSREAGAGLFGHRWQDAKDAVIVRSGIDTRRFAAVDCTPPPPDDRTLTIAHIARLDWQKNQAFVVQVMAEIARAKPQARLLLAGADLQGSWLEHRLRRDAPSGRIDIRPPLADTAPLFTREIDVLLLPSLHEGLPRVALEAQAAGVPVAMSNTITPETIIIDDLVKTMPLAAGIDVWRDAVIDLAYRHREGRLTSPASCVKIMQASEFSIDRNVESLERLYADLVGDITEQ